MARKHVKIALHPDFGQMKPALHNVTLDTLVLTRDEISQMADFLMDVACDDLAGEVYNWLENNQQAKTE